MDSIDINSIINSYNLLWGTKIKGCTLEIITPFATINNTFVSVFVSKQDEYFIISDGGLLNTSYYERVDLLFNKLRDILNIKTTQGYYYLKCSNKSDIASKLLDMVIFIQYVVNDGFLNEIHSEY